MQIVDQINIEVGNFRRSTPETAYPQRCGQIGSDSMSQSISGRLQ
ncbi:hypothetical protein IL54_4817 [Sphingobium sp. ba1]|jgi:hypothetical protein|nr:hypothetical protein IL54_4817 [Sphingobium sp. ba1]